MTKRSKGGYGKKCQTFQCKYQMAPENTQCCKAQNINNAPRITNALLYTQYFEFNASIPQI